MTLDSLQRVIEKLRKRLRHIVDIWLKMKPALGRC